LKIFKKKFKNLKIIAQKLIFANQKNMLENGMSRVLLLANRKTVK
jgi:hypothetical protein